MPVQIIGTKKCKIVYALLDEGSTVTIINSKVVDEIGLNTTKAEVLIRGIGDGETSVIGANNKTEFEIEVGNDFYCLKNVLVVNNLSLPRQSLPEDLSIFCKQETGIEIFSYSCNPEILIGQDNINLILTRDFKILPNTSLFVSNCLLGWSIHGNFSSSCSITNYENLAFNIDARVEYEELDTLIRQYFDLEYAGLSDSSNDDQTKIRALEILENTSKYVDGVWEVGLLWRSEDTDLPNSRQTALRRLKLLENKLDRDPKYAELYYKEMDRLFENKFAIKAPGPPTGQRKWYLPHFGVQKIDKPDKVRLVLDAACKTHSISFNDLLLAGPDLLKSLIGILLRFRRFRVAFKSDKKDMFLKIKIRQEDQDAQRFLWRGRDRSGIPEECIFVSMFFGSKSSPVSALFIKQKNAEKFRSIYPQAAESIVENSYMDDYLDSVDTVGEARDRISQVIEISKHANWEMHSWASNIPDLFSDMPQIQTPNQSVFPVSSIENVEKILGLKWVNVSDDFIFQVNKNKISDEIISGEKVPTKREFLSIIMSIFDPLGFLTPYTIRSRILMQDVHKSKIGWDMKLQDKEFFEWKKWISDMIDVENFKIPRCYQLPNVKFESVELHIFCDSSLKAFSAVAYWRFVLPNHEFHTAFVMSKSRVKPSKAELTIPRLELEAAVLGVRLAKIIWSEKVFDISHTTFWSDSQTILHWIKRDPKEFKVFTMNRLEEIRKISKDSEWKWVPGTDNPADDGTRFTRNALEKNSRWLVGPEFLRKKQQLWPSEVDCGPQGGISDLELSELRAQPQTQPILTVVASDNLIDFSKFSSWKRLISVTTRFLQAIDIWLNRHDSDVNRLCRAEKLCFQISQINSFSNEVRALKNSQALTKKSRLWKLDPKLDDEGILRVGGRLSNLSVGELSPDPIILHATDKAAILLMKFYHERFFHGSHLTVLNEIKQNFWILGLRRGLRKIVHNCIICKFLRGLPANPKMGNLPVARLGFRLSPFSNTGLDFFGPLYVKVGRKKEKRWCALFTCLTIRAIHLELLPSISADSTIMALQRFIARRGVPQKIYSDSGTGFKGASKELMFAIRKLDNQKIDRFCTKNKIHWSFNPPSAPHMGGAWERLIRSVKVALSSVLSGKITSEEILLTTLLEIEHAINSRPLTEVSLDPRDREALTPNHFIIGSSSGQIKFNHSKMKIKTLRSHWLSAQNLADECWMRWLREYLPSLNTRSKWQKSEKPLKQGDMVLILDNNTERNQWKKGIIIRTFPGTDGHVRTVEVQTSDGVLKRPSRKLIKFAEKE